MNLKLPWAQWAINFGFEALGTALGKKINS
jgi:hypothetical protein